MLDILQQHVAAKATPELLAALEDAHRVFERIGLENYEQGFEEILMIDGSEVAGDKDTVQATLELTRALLTQILRDHAITLSEDTPLTMATDIVNALLDLQNYSDLATLQATATIDGLPLEVFAELVTLVTTYSAHEVMVHLAEVDWFLIKRIRELASRTLSDEEIAQNNQRIERYRALLLRAIETTALSSQLDVVNALKGGLGMGMPFTVYLQQFGWQLGQQWSVERAGQELLAMALISRDGCDNPRAMIAEHIEKYVPGLDRITQIDVDITGRLLKIEHHEQA